MFAALNSFLTRLGRITDPYWANVSMLLHGDGTNAAQNNTFLDGSTNNFTVTRNGNTTQGSFNPFVSTYPYAVATNGGSGYFDGTGDYLTVPDNAAFTLGTNDFTIECWIYPTTSGALGLFAGQSDAGITSRSFLLQRATNSSISARVTSLGVALTINSGVSLAATNAWTHVAFVRNSTATRLYLNGVQAVSGVIAGSPVDDSTGSVGIGSYGDYTTDLFAGYISNFRLVNGTCLYPSGTTFTPPTAPLTAVTNTALLLGMSNGAIYDNTMLNNLETVADAQISTSVFKYGTGSMKFDGTGDHLVPNPPNQTAFAFGSGDFTIEMWINPIQVGVTLNFLYDGRTTSEGTFPTIYVEDVTSLLIYRTNGATRITGGVVSTTAWTHIALCRSGTSTKLFMGGVQSGSTYTDSTVYTNTGLRPIIGANQNGAFSWNGYIDDLRVTKGIARYTTTFTPPTAAFPNLGP